MRTQKEGRKEKSERILFIHISHPPGQEKKRRLASLL
jgi:hypothetical protein